MMSEMKESWRIRFLWFVQVEERKKGETAEGCSRQSATELRIRLGDGRNAGQVEI